MDEGSCVLLLSQYWTLIMVHIFGLSENILFCPTFVFLRGMSNSNNDLVLYLLNEGANMPLTLPAPCISESCIKIEVNLNFYFPSSLWCMALMKPFKAPKRNVKIKI